MNDSLESHNEQSLEPLSPEVMAKKRRMSKELDVICTGGRRGGTSFLPTSKNTIPREVLEGLNATGGIISPTTERAVRERELHDPTTIPILDYSPQKSVSFFRDAQQYAEQHIGDTAPRLFGKAKLEDLDHLLAVQKQLVDATDPQNHDELLRKIDLPLFLEIPEHFRYKQDAVQQLFERILQGDAQGVIFEKQSHIEPFRREWEEYVDALPTKLKPARPFMGLRGDIDELTAFMESKTEKDVDTLVFSRIPKIEQAQHIHRLHIERMLRNTEPRHIMHGFNEDTRTDHIKVGFIDVQGSARKDAGALIEAVENAKYNVSVFLVENAKQLEACDPDAIILPGGWHAIQHRLQEELGINELIVQYVRQKRHLLALCAGSIQTRTADSGVDEVKSVGCNVAAAIGVGKYKVYNNSLKGPHDLRIAVHNRGRDPIAPNSRVFRQVPLSNAPYYTGIDTTKMDVIARISSEPRARDINDEDGLVVGLQVKQNEPKDPVQMVAAFHDKIIFRIFLNDLMIWKHHVRHSHKTASLIDGYYEDEMTLPEA